MVTRDLVERLCDVRGCPNAAEFSYVHPGGEGVAYACGVCVPSLRDVLTKHELPGKIAPLETMPPEIRSASLPS